MNTNLLTLSLKVSRFTLIFKLTTLLNTHPLCCAWIRAKKQIVRRHFLNINSPKLSINFSHKRCMLYSSKFWVIRSNELSPDDQFVLLPVSHHSVLRIYLLELLTDTVLSPTSRSSLFSHNNSISLMV